MKVRGSNLIAENGGGITQDDYDRKARELKDRQTEIALRIEQHQKGEGDYRTTLESLISVQAAELFERSKVYQKRELIACQRDLDVSAANADVVGRVDFARNRSIVAPSPAVRFSRAPVAER